jgi:hypothetical protein
VNAESIMLLGGITAFLLTVNWVRRRQLREKYALGWIVFAALLLLCGMFPQGIMSLATLLHLSYPAAVLLVTLTVIYCFAFSVTVSLSRQFRQNLRLTQELALLDPRLRLLEQQLEPAPLIDGGNQAGCRPPIAAGKAVTEKSCS